MVKKGPWGDRGTGPGENAALAYLLRVVPEKSAELLRWPQERVEEAANKLREEARLLAEDMEVLFHKHREMMKERSKKHGTVALAVEVEFMSEVAGAIHTGDSMDALYQKLVNEAMHERAVKLLWR